MKPSFITPSGFMGVIGFLTRKDRLLKGGLFLVVTLCLILFFSNRAWLSGPDHLKSEFQLPLFFQSDFWRDSAVSFFEILAAFFITILSVLIIFLLSSHSRSIRSFLQSLMTLFGAVPMLALLGIMNLFVNDFWTVSLLASSMLVVRCVSPVLKVGPEIPSLLQKSAKAMRLTPGQQFWKLHIPVAYPAMIRAVTLDMPHFWIRLLGAEWLLSLLHPSEGHGLGGYVFHCMQRHDLFEFYEVFCVIVILILALHIICLKPFLKRIHRYDVSALGQTKHMLSERSEKNSGGFCKNLVVTLFFMLLSGILLSSGQNQLSLLGASSFKALLIWGGSLGSALLVWMVIGSKTIESSPSFRVKARSWAYISSLLPFFLLSFLAKNLWEEILLFTLVIQGAYGASIFYRAEDRLRNDLLKAAYRLRLSHYQIWRRVKLMLLAPSLARGAVLASYPLWDLILLGGIMSAAYGTLQNEDWGMIYLQALLSGNYAYQLGLFFLFMTFSYGLTCLFLYPFRSQALRKFRIHP